MPRDLGLLLGASWLVYTDVLRQRLAAAGFDDIREPDGIMFRMLHHRNGMTVSEIGVALDITKQGASKIVIGLEQRGYVYRERVMQDQRERLVRLTERGEQVRALGVQLAGEIEHDIRKAVGDVAVDGLHAALSQLIDSHAAEGSSLARLAAAIDQES